VIPPDPAHWKPDPYVETLVIDLGVVYPTVNAADHTYLTVVVPRSDLPAGYREWTTPQTKAWMERDPKYMGMYMGMYWAEHRWGRLLEEPVDVDDRRRR